MNNDKQNERKFTAWHISFENILVNLISLDKFKIEARVTLGELPLEADIIIINNKTDIESDLPYFFDFFNNYKYIILEYKSPKDYFDFYDYITLNCYAGLYVNKIKIEKINEVCIVGVFNNISSKSKELMKQNNFRIENYKNGVYIINKNPYDGYLINIDELELHNRELSLSLISNNYKKYREEIKEYSERDNKFSTIINNINIILKKLWRNPMYVLNDDKELIDRLNWTLEQTMQEIPIEIRLHGLKPEERLSGLKPEERLSGLKPEERLHGLKPEERLSGLKPEERLHGLKPEEIRAYLENIENKN